MSRALSRRLLAAALAVAGAVSYLDGSAQEATRGAALYERECSKCHGLLTTVTGQRRAPARLSPARLSPARLSPARLTPTRLAIALVAGAERRLAVALPYGPGLVGVYGRPAGTVEGYEYSKAFREHLTDVVWDHQTLDDYLRDSQLRAPGVLMYYKQPEIAVRQQIIDYLEKHGPR